MKNIICLITLTVVTFFGCKDYEVMYITQLQNTEYIKVYTYTITCKIQKNDYENYCDIEIPDNVKLGEIIVNKDFTDVKCIEGLNYEIDKELTELHIFDGCSGTFIFEYYIQ